MMKLKKHKLKKKGIKINQANKSGPFKLELRSQTRNSLNFRPELNQEAQFPTNLMLINQSISNKEQYI